MRNLVLQTPNLQVLDGLSFLHSSGFTHGLFGPLAVFVNSQGDYRPGPNGWSMHQIITREIGYLVSCDAGIKWTNPGWAGTKWQGEMLQSRRGRTVEPHRTSEVPSRLGSFELCQKGMDTGGIAQSSSAQRLHWSSFLQNSGHKNGWRMAKPNFALELSPPLFLANLDTLTNLNSP